MFNFPSKSVAGWRCTKLMNHHHLHLRCYDYIAGYDGRSSRSNKPTSAPRLEGKGCPRSSFKQLRR